MRNSGRFMGRNLPSKKHKVGNPTHRYLRYILDHNPNDGDNDSHYIDIAQGLSALNRRFYRQGLYYYVSGVTVHDSNQNAWVKFATAPDTWITKNSWVRAFRAWSKLNSVAAGAAGANDLAIAGKYHDFKVYLNDYHRTNADSGLLPIGSLDYNSITGSFPNYVITPGAVPFESDEWTYSKLITGDPVNSDPQQVDEFFIHLLGPHVGSSGAFTSIGCVKSYADTKAQVEVTSPDLPPETSSDPILNLFDTGDNYDNILDDLENDSDEVPYDHDVYIGERADDTLIVAQTANSQGAGAVTRAPGFVVPFGLLEVITNASTAGKIEIVLELASGNYNGVAAARVC